MSEAANDGDDDSTDLEAGHLSRADREAFVRGWGLEPGALTDEDILMAMSLGQF